VTKPSVGNEVVVRYEHVSKRFGSKVVLQDLDLVVRRGETLVIMGPSGIGKSVTLRHAVGLLQPDSGRVLVEGHDMATIDRMDLIALRRRMGYLFQDGALINWLSVGENVALPLRENTQLPEAEIRAKVQAKLERVRIPDSWNKMPSQISGGMKKRVGLARALITEPQIILYDEPNAGLDPEISASINELIQSLKEELHVTSIVVEHRVGCIRHVADEVLFLEGGKALLRLPTAEFFSTKHPRVLKFLGEKPD